ncbi:hypothetical protein MNV49_003050 [Pseudohyphozyma bogoriensis]|nr:hypothetical protein MNV49_003050 [Pseudohyphozyma bogoriensis]
MSSIDIPSAATEQTPLTSASVTELADPSKSIAPVLAEDQKGTVRIEAHRNYSFAAAAWLTTLAIPLLFFPRVLSLIFGALLTESGDPDGEGKAEVIRQLNVLERSLAGLTGMAVLSLAAILIVQTGAVPLTTHITSNNSSPDALYRIPTIVITTGFFSALAWYSYDLGFWLVAGISGALVGWGFWAVIFGTESRVNKHMNSKAASSFPFKNEHAEEKKQ